MFNLIKVKLLSLYLEDPCATQPNALWKTFEFMDRFQSNCKYLEGLPTDILLWNDDIGQTIWNKSKKVSQDACKLMNANKLMVHKEYDIEEIKEHYTVEKVYFRVQYNKGYQSDTSLSPRLKFLSIDPDRDIPKLVALINACYQDIQLDEDTVRGWVERPVYKKDLWVWIIDKTTNLAIGAGIAEVDQKIPEGSLEWIQILPEFRKQGLGKSLVDELVQRLLQYTSLITVSGLVDHPTNPDGLYRKCGFTGHDQWLLLQRNKNYF